MTHHRWRLIPHETEEGFLNLTGDAELLKKRLPFPVLRFYSWSHPCFSYGHLQKPPQSSEGVPAYRRITGGGIVFHDKDLTYSLTYSRESILPWSVKRSYQEIHGVIQRALVSLGIHTILCTEENRGHFCFESPVMGDLLYQGKKIAGAAQRRKGNHLLHQGTILVEYLGIDRFRLLEAIVAEFKRNYGVIFEEWREERFLSLKI